MKVTGVNGQTLGASTTLNEPSHTNGHVNGQTNGERPQTSPSSTTNGSNGHTNGSTDEGLLGKTILEPVAICGLALRLPGGIKTASDFWDVLYNGTDTRSPIPPDRYNAKGFSNELGKKGAIKTQYGYFLDEDLSCLDASFFTMTRTELEKTDPQQRQILEVARECLENAGEVNYRGKLIGCYVGTFGDDWLYSQAKENQYVGGYNLSGDLMIANRVSYEYDLKGPSMVIKTGCSASLIGVHEACRALQVGDCTSAIVAGTSLIMGPTTTAAMTTEGIISPEGSCKTFDAAADGFARGEAINAIYLKLLSSAIKDGNPIRAVIRNSGTNSDGRSASLMAPNSESHEALMRSVYQDINLDPRRTAFVECHGTGTPTGDPIETTAVGNVFGDEGVFIGSVKPNVGHSEGASGLTSLIKGVLALEHNTIPPNIKFSRPNPKIPFAEKKLVVPTQPTAWPKDRAQRISINSFGIGGSNAHVILDSVMEVQSLPKKITKASTQKTPHLLLYSANTQESLKTMMTLNQGYLEKHPERIADVAYSLSQRREHLPFRAFSIAGVESPDAVSSITKSPANTPLITMVFNGQGAQWATMGKELIDTDPGFKKDISAMDSILQGLLHPPDWKIETELLRHEKTSQLHRAAMAQPLCTAIQIALFNSLSRRGINPKLVVGHSSGEIAAAYATGAISLAEAIIVAYYRGYITKEQSLGGAMAAIGLGAKQVSMYLRNGVVIACENSPNSTTISGNSDAVEEVLEAVKTDRPDALARKLKVDMAYHSHHMWPLAEKYLDLLRDELEEQNIVKGEMGIPLCSSVSNSMIINAETFGPDYWVANLTSPVRFQSAVGILLKHQPQSVLFLEIGPHSTLAGPLRQICAEFKVPCLHIPTMIRSANCTSSLLSAFGQLYQHGHVANFASLIPVGKVLTDMPLYPWDHSGSFWQESRLSKEYRLRPVGHHALLGQRITQSTSLDPSWRVILELEDEPWLYDHKVKDDVVFPFAGYISMAGEALRQITGSDAGYSIRHAVAHTALVLSDTKPVEIVTTLRQHKLTDSTDSTGWDFIISSYSGSSWIKHCVGQVKPSEKDVLSTQEFDALPRKVPTSRWYEIMARVGLVYGPEFRGLSEVTSSTSEKVAVARVQNTKQRQDAPFIFHPAAIDACLQLVLAAMAQGGGRNFTQLCVPTLIEELDISRSALSMDARAYCSEDGKNVGVDCIADGKVALRLRGARLTPLDEEKAATEDRHAAARLEWNPDFDFMDIAPLFTPPVADDATKLLLEELSLLCLIDSADRLVGLATEQPHYLKYRDWLAREIKRAESGTYPVVKDAADYVKLSREDRLQGIKDRYEKVSTTASIGLVAKGIIRISESIEGLFTGTVDTLDLLMEDDVLTEIYNAVSFGFGDFVRHLSNTKPNLRILEVGAGTGGTTELILRDLVGSGGNPAYSTYCFTDISAGFFPQAGERFSYAPNMAYKVFDISQSPFDQGFEASSYDLILAPNVVHATPNLQETLRNLRPLLRPHGHLVLSEVCAVARAPGYVFGNFAGWWLGEADGRKYEPYVQVDRWDQELKDAGFTGADTAVYDAEEPYQYCAAIVSQPKPQKYMFEGRPITVLCESPEGEVARHLISDLKESGFTVTTSSIEQGLLKDQDVISTLDLESHFFENISQKKFLAFQKLLSNHDSQNILWLMPPTQIRCLDPRSAQSIGMIRVIRAELAIPFNTLEIDSSQDEFSDLVMKVFNKIRTREDIDKILPDREFAVDGGIVKIGRYQPFSLAQEMCEKSALSACDVVQKLHIAKPGLLETMQWVGVAAADDLKDDQVEVETRAIGLNFRDIMVSMGVLKFGDKEVPLGLEASGIVRRVGNNVHHVAVGDRVVAIATEGCFSTKVILKSSLVAKIPDRLGFEEAASMPSCYITAMKALMDVGQLQKNQTVLIHSACGGVGHAALHLCEMIGATVYATVSSEKKVNYLIENFGIPKNRILYSRDDSFLLDLMRETRGRGVDIVLNSLSGDLLHASWKCVAEFGKMIELGKRDLVEFGALDLETFLANRTYACVDLAHTMDKRPETVGGLLRKCIDLYQLGLIPPISPMAVFDASEIEQSFRYLQKGDHIGKAIVQIPEDSSSLPSNAQAKPLKFSPDHSYLLTGGLGGLGRSIATWMVESGARHLVFLSRSAGSSEDDKVFFAELEDMGCCVTAVAGKVQDSDDLKRAILKAVTPIKGVIHLAMVLRDAPVLDLTYQGWTDVIGPKVDGAWNLHHAFLNEKLDFFIMASSLVTLIDQPGQGNYAAANTFLESLCQYRHALGLPASVLGICPVDDIGFVAENSVVRKKLKSQGLYFLPERELLEYMELCVLNSYPPSPSPNSENPQASWRSTGHIVMGLRSETHLEDPSCQTSWRRDRRMGMYHNVRNEANEGTAANSNALKVFLSRASDYPEILTEKASAEYLALEIGKKVFKFMMKPEEDVEISLTLAQIGIDSLMAIELRRWWKQAFGLDISVLEIMGSGTLEQLGVFAAEGLQKKLGGGGGK